MLCSGVGVCVCVVCGRRGGVGTVAQKGQRVSRGKACGVWKSFWSHGFKSRSGKGNGRSAVELARLGGAVVCVCV